MIIQTPALLKSKISKASERMGQNTLFFIQVKNGKKDGLIIGFKTIASQSYTNLTGPAIVAMTGSYGSCRSIFDIVENKIPDILKCGVGDSRYLNGEFICERLAEIAGIQLKEELEACSGEILVCEFPIEQPPWIIKLGGTMEIAKYGVLGARDENGKLKQAELEEKFMKTVKAGIKNKNITSKKALEVMKIILRGQKKETADPNNEYVYQIQTFHFDETEEAVRKKVIKL